MDWRQKYLTTLYHHGIKGQKWGVRRTPEELKYNKHSVEAFVNNRAVKVTTSNGKKITSMSSHAGDQAQSRKVSAKEIVDALKSPLYIKPTKSDKSGRPSQQFIGKESTVSINPDSGVITSVWRTGTKTREKYQRGGK